MVGATSAVAVCPTVTTITTITVVTTAHTSPTPHTNRITTMTTPTTPTSHRPRRVRAGPTPTTNRLTPNATPPDPSTHATTTASITTKPSITAARLVYRHVVYPTVYDESNIIAIHPTIAARLVRAEGNIIIIINIIFIIMIPSITVGCSAAGGGNVHPRGMHSAAGTHGTLCVYSHVVDACDPLDRRVGRE